MNLKRMVMNNSELEIQKISLIEIIEWYRDNYHKKDFCHSEMIEKIKQVTEENQLSYFEQIADGWL